jgi:Tfp pilus assembly protein PilP
MKRMTTILVCVLAAGLAWAQSPEIIQKTRNSVNTAQNNATAASNQALGVTTPAPPAAKAASSAAKPSATATKPSAVQATKPKSPAAPSVKPTASTKSPAAPSVKPAVSTKAPTVKPAASTKSAPAVAVKPAPATKPGKAATPEKKVVAAPKSGKPAASSGKDAASAGAAETAKSNESEQDSQDRKWSMSGKRDPFVSPVVNHTGGSGCSTGKKCLEIGAINLRGVVHSDAGFIAVVTNSLNKAYFLRENDPVFDGYVVKITGDSIVFKETVQDRLGKTFTREVVKKIATSAV